MIVLDVFAGILIFVMLVIVAVGPMNWFSRLPLPEFVKFPIYVGWVLASGVGVPVTIFYSLGWLR